MIASIRYAQYPDSYMIASLFHFSGASGVTKYSIGNVGEITSGPGTTGYGG